MRTMAEMLMEIEKNDLIDLTIRLGLPLLREEAPQEDWARYLADGCDTHGENILLVLRHDETKALMAALAKGCCVPEAEADGELLGGLIALEEFCLAECLEDGWEVDPRVAGWLKLDEASLAQQHMQDALYGYMMGWLAHVGMMPMEELTARAAALLDADSPEETADLMHLCHSLLIARNSLGGLYLDEYEEAWAMTPSLDDPEALRERLRLPFLAKMPYPDFDPDALANTGISACLAGSIRLYKPLLEGLKEQNVEDAEGVLFRIAQMIQNEKAEDVIPMLREECGLRGFSAAERLSDLVTDLSNAMPRWYNKGYSPDEMARRMIRGTSKVAMPGRNSPCPCGSGRKYKQCCGSRLH